MFPGARRVIVTWLTPAPEAGILGNKVMYE